MIGKRAIYSRAADLLEHQAVTEESSATVPAPAPASYDAAWEEFIQELGGLQQRALSEGIGPRTNMVEWAILLRPDAPAPAEGEVAELVAWLRANSSGVYRPCRRAADLLEQRQAAPVPVAVSERLPRPEDCDAEGRCWWLVAGCEAWALGRRSPTVTHWLPFNALPLPTPEPQP